MAQTTRFPRALKSLRPRVQSTEVETAYAALLAEAGYWTTQQIVQRLLEILDHLTNLQSREELELLVLNDVLIPRPFRERLMIAAAQAFRWDESLRHLAEGSSWPARELDRWLQERAFLQANAGHAGLDVDTPLAWAREYFHDRERHVPSAIEARIIETVHDMQRSFPTVLRYRLDRQIVDYWLSRPRAEEPSSPAARSPSRGQPVPAREAKSGSRVGIGILIAIMFSVLGRLGGPAHDAPSRPTSPERSLRAEAVSFHVRCQPLYTLDRVKGALTIEQQALLAECRAKDLLYVKPFPDADLGLKLPKDISPQRK